MISVWEPEAGEKGLLEGAVVGAVKPKCQESGARHFLEGASAKSR